MIACLAAAWVASHIGHVHMSKANMNFSSLTAEMLRWKSTCVEICDDRRPGHNCTTHFRCCRPQSKNKWAICIIRNNHIRTSILIIWCFFAVFVRKQFDFDVRFLALIDLNITFCSNEPSMDECT